jgi:hypothetical protein
MSPLETDAVIDHLHHEIKHLREKLRDVRSALVPLAVSYGEARVGEWGSAVRFDSDKVEVSAGALRRVANLLDTI